jgi:hypothetical protein
MDNMLHKLQCQEQRGIFGQSLNLKPECELIDLTAQIQALIIPKDKVIRDHLQ